MSALVPDTTAAIVEELMQKFGSVFSEAEISFVVDDSRATLEQCSRTRHYLPVLVRKDAHDRLVQMARYRGGRRPT